MDKKKLDKKSPKKDKRSSKSKNAKEKATSSNTPKLSKVIDDDNDKNNNTINDCISNNNQENSDSLVEAIDVIKRIFNTNPDNISHPFHTLWLLGFSPKMQCAVVGWRSESKTAKKSFVVQTQVNSSNNNNNTNNNYTNLDYFIDLLCMLANLVVTNNNNNNNNNNISYTHTDKNRFTDLDDYRNVHMPSLEEVASEILEALLTLGLILCHARNKIADDTKDSLVNCITNYFAILLSEGDQDKLDSIMRVTCANLGNRSWAHAAVLLRSLKLLTIFCGDNNDDNDDNNSSYSNPKPWHDFLLTHMDDFGSGILSLAEKLCVTDSDLTESYYYKMMKKVLDKQSKQMLAYTNQCRCIFDSDKNSEVKILFKKGSSPTKKIFISPWWSSPIKLTIATSNYQKVFEKPTKFTSILEKTPGLSDFSTYLKEINSSANPHPRFAQKACCESKAGFKLLILAYNLDVAFRAIFDDYDYNSDKSYDYVKKVHQSLERCPEWEEDLPGTPDVLLLHAAFNVYHHPGDGYHDHNHHVRSGRRGGGRPGRPRPYPPHRRIRGVTYTNSDDSDSDSDISDSHSTMMDTIVSDYMTFEPSETCFSDSDCDCDDSGSDVEVVGINMLSDSSFDDDDDDDNNDDDDDDDDNNDDDDHNFLLPTVVDAVMARPRLTISSSDINNISNRNQNRNTNRNTNPNTPHPAESSGVEGITLRSIDDFSAASGVDNESMRSGCSNLEGWGWLDSRDIDDWSRVAIPLALAIACPPENKECKASEFLQFSEQQQLSNSDAEAMHFTNLLNETKNEPFRKQNNNPCSDYDYCKTGPNVMRFTLKSYLNQLDIFLWITVRRGIHNIWSELSRRAGMILLSVTFGLDNLLEAFSASYVESDTTNNASNISNSNNITHQYDVSAFNPKRKNQIINAFDQVKHQRHETRNDKGKERCSLPLESRFDEGFSNEDHLATFVDLLYCEAVIFRFRRKELVSLSRQERMYARQSRSQCGGDESFVDTSMDDDVYLTPETRSKWMQVKADTLAADILWRSTLGVFMHRQPALSRRPCRSVLWTLACLNPRVNSDLISEWGILLQTLSENTSCITSLDELESSTQLSLDGEEVDDGGELRPLRRISSTEISNQGIYRTHLYVSSDADPLSVLSEDGCMIGMLLQRIDQVGHMLVFGLTGQIAGSSNRVLSDFEKDSFAGLIDLLFRIFIPRLPALCQSLFGSIREWYGKESMFKMVCDKTFPKHEILWDSLKRSLQLFQSPIDNYQRIVDLFHGMWFYHIMTEHTCVWEGPTHYSHGKVYFISPFTAPTSTEAASASKVDDNMKSLTIESTESIESQAISDMKLPAMHVNRSTAQREMYWKLRNPLSDIAATVDIDVTSDTDTIPSLTTVKNKAGISVRSFDGIVHNMSERYLSVWCSGKIFDHTVSRRLISPSNKQRWCTDQINISLSPSVPHYCYPFLIANLHGFNIELPHDVVHPFFITNDQHGYMHDPPVDPKERIAWAPLEMPVSFIDSVKEMTDGLQYLLDCDEEVLDDLPFLLDVPGIVNGEIRNNFVLSVFDADEDHDSVDDTVWEVKLNRFLPTYEWMDSVLNQIHAEASLLLLAKPIQGPSELAHNKRLLGVNFENEPGEGPGPLKEFIDYCSQLFSPQPVSEIYSSDLWKKKKIEFMSKYVFVSKFPFFSLVPGEGKQVRPRIIEEVARVPIPEKLLERLTNLMPAQGYTIPHTLFSVHKRLDKNGKETEDKRVTKIRQVYVGLGIILGHCYREGGSMGVDFPEAIWAFLLGHPPSSDWRYYCSGGGEDAARIRNSIEYILSVDDVADLTLEFTAPITTRSIFPNEEKLKTKDYVLRCETTPIINAAETTLFEISSTVKGLVREKDEKNKEEEKMHVKSKTPNKKTRKYKNKNKNKNISNNNDDNDNTNNDESKEKETEPSTTTPTATFGPTPTPKTPVAVVSVTNANRQEYVLRWARAWCFQGCEESLACIKLGLDRTVPPSLLRTLDARHTRLFMRGATSVNVEELRQCVSYDAPYFEGHRVILMFWKCMEELTDEQRGKLLQFWTGSIVPPYSGFMADAVRDSGIEEGGLRISKIWKAQARTTSENMIGHLPEATTCNKELYLPEYDSMKILRKAILNALEFSSKGFDRA